MTAEIIPLGKPRFTMVRVTPAEEALLESYRAMSPQMQRKFMAILKVMGCVRRRLPSDKREELHEALTVLFS